MFLDFSKFRATVFPVSIACSLLMGFLCLTSGWGPQSSIAQVVGNQGGLVVQQPAIVQPGQVIQGQPIQGGVIQGQPIQGGVIGPGQIIQQPIPNQSIQPGGPIYQGQSVQQTLPPIVTTVPQPQDDNARKALEAERAAYKAAKIEVEKLLEKNRNLVAQNEGAREQFESLTQENKSLKTKMGQINEAKSEADAQVVELKKKLEAAGDNDPEAMQAAERLRAQIEEASNQNQTLRGQIKTLTGQNDGFRVKIAELTEAMSAKPEQDNLSELTQLNQNLTQELQLATQSNQKLTTDYRTAVAENQRLAQEKQTLEQQHQLALEEAKKTHAEQITELTASNDGYAKEIASLKARPKTVAQPTTNVAALETKIARLERENRNLSQINAEFEENLLLDRQVKDLETQPTQPEIETALLDVTAEPAVALAAPAEALGFDFSRFGVWGWMIPFLALGLGIAFFVIMRDEIHRPPTASGSVRDAGKSSNE